MSSRAERQRPPFGPDALLERLQRQYPSPDRYWIAFSGGLDSTVLLHLMASVRSRLAAPIAAVHVDHGLQSASAQWAEHCAAECQRLGIAYESLRVAADAQSGESPEAAARRARYAAIERRLGPRALLLTAHHRDDQAETLLLQLLRGAGVEGLAAMPELAERAYGWHARPLLAFARASLHGWAARQRLRWIEDPSNAASVADRNYLRHRVLPVLSARWPGTAQCLANSARHCADAAAVIRAQAAQDLSSLTGDDPWRLSLRGLRELPPERALSALRAWLRRQQLPPMPRRRLIEALDQLCDARPDAAVRIPAGRMSLRRYRDQVWLVADRPAEPVERRHAWSGGDLPLGPGLGVVSRRLLPGGIDPAHWGAGRVEVGYRLAGLSCRPAGRAGRRSFKDIAQQYGIPPWLRDITPVLFIDDRVAAIANCCVCEPFAAAADRPGWWIEWLPAQPPGPDPRTAVED